ncbi:MAG: TonB-dependent receptor [Cytophagaceae bacterium]|nr:TonB-dependent receptor [Gemmatimonadaceae bacterium]
MRLTLVALLVSARAGAQVAAGFGIDSVVLTGVVLDATSRRPIARAEVLLRDSPVRGFTGLDGRFLLRARTAGPHAITVRRLGYQPATLEGVATGGESVTIALAPAPYRLAAVTVAPGAFTFLESVPTARFALSREAIENAPFGEDLFRAINRLPGLSSGDYGAQFSIRGGRHDETLILLDGLEIYEPFHLKDFNEGALSIIDVETIDGVELLAGGFPAHFGDKRSGVMRITSRTPREDGTHVRLGASLTNAHAMAEGSFAGRRGSWLVSGRRGFVDFLLGMINKKETKAPTYYDAFGTLRYKLAANHSVALNVLTASDRYKFGIDGTTGFNDTIRTRESANNGYGNSYAWLTLRSLLGSHVSVTTLVSAGKVDATREGDERHVLRPIELYSVNGHRDFTLRGVKQDFSYQASDRMALDWGFDLRSLRADFDWTNRVTQNPDDPTPDTLGFYPRITTRSKQTSGTTLGAYISDRLHVAGPLTLEAGLRYDRATYTGDRDWSPRLHGLVQLSPRNTLRAGWGQYRQRQGVADENAFDRLNRYFPSEVSRQWTLGFEHQYVAGGSFRVEVYDKAGSRLRPILRNWKSGLNMFPESSEDRILVYPESNTSRGLELYHERSLGRRLNLRAGYALASVEERLRRVDNVNDPLKLVFDSTHAAPQDQRHALNLDVSYRPATNWTLSGALTYHSGWPFTEEIGVPVRRRNGTMDLTVRPDTLWGKRLPAYQRVDVRLTRRRSTANGEFRFFIEAINLMNRENVLGYDVFRVRDASGALRLERDVETWFSILPLIGVHWSRRF